ncbi:hypothetical protein [Spirosoma sordidisoli]|uniref:Uncharacterized protein n=1 Tax=Spirosoma sordidisoli TaxID=2502893 RepID=A0A4Q2UKI8_9BACT|nr:hypothetical protein [Spirosoma sordidisoli]RYC70033.1 hypothetical protein EQG79_09185 [Spirosoma sordidisoli]
MKNDEFHATFTLRQHTPMIHFQADQPGALLRASELKPAFDNYLWRNVFKIGANTERNKIIFEENKAYLAGYSQNRDKDVWQEFEQQNWALDYRVRIDYDLDKVKPTSIPPKFPCFFGDMGDQQPSITRKFTQIDGDFTVTFACFHSELVEVIRRYFADFLRTKNFGLRQSKGFGCFTAQISNRSVVPLQAHNAYFFRVDGLRTNDLFKHIELFWRVLRAGYNRPDGQGRTVIYVKCPLFFYLRDQWHIDVAATKAPEEFKARMIGKSVQWDKRSIKQAYFSTELARQQSKPSHLDILEGYSTQSDNDRYFLFRDLLGLSSESQWKSYSATIKKVHRPQKGQETIDRFKSPVTFKPIQNGNGYDVYVCIRPIPPEFGNQAFSIQRGKENRLTLETPPPGSFKITDYFEYVRKEIADKIVDADRQVVTLNDERDPDWLKIVAIFESFRKI